MHKVKNKNIHNVFKKSFNLTNNKYETKSSNFLFYKPFCLTKYTQFSISYRGPQNKVLLNLKILSFGFLFVIFV